MNENYEPCMELNEIIYHISGEFWKKAYNELLRKWNFWSRRKKYREELFDDRFRYIS